LSTYFDQLLVFVVFEQTDVDDDDDDDDDGDVCRGQRAGQYL